MRDHNMLEYNRIYIFPVERGTQARRHASMHPRSMHVSTQACMHACMHLSLSLSRSLALSLSRSLALSLSRSLSLSSPVRHVWSGIGFMVSLFGWRFPTVTLCIACVSACVCMFMFMRLAVHWLQLLHASLDLTRSSTVTVATKLCFTTTCNSKQ